VGGRAQRDTRDSSFYPRTGSFADMQLRVFDPALGSPFAYSVLPLSYDHYFSPGVRDVVALRLAGRLAFGDVPFYGQSFFGAGGDLRGYPVGEYHDEVLLAAQAEYRRELIGWLSAVAFAGLGTVAPALDELDEGPTLPSTGIGLRFTLEKQNHVNFRIDLGWGRDEAVVYLGVGEAF
jgi:outer membrane translocation and assembly module TamA